MQINRRHILFAAATIATTRLQSAQTRAQDKRVSQPELDEAIRLHAMWLADIKAGRRCTFSGRDLSGLRFGTEGAPPVSLSGADFSQADLSETQADDILIDRCNFNGAKFDNCYWKQPVFAYADLRRASAKQATWGVPNPQDPLDLPGADFSHAALHDADLTEAKLSGFFFDTKLFRTRLCHADLSYSTFFGPKFCETIFTGANLIGAKLRYCRISSAHFYNSNCTEVDFSHSDFADVRMKDCNLSGASFSNAIFERRVDSVQSCFTGSWVRVPPRSPNLRIRSTTYSPTQFAVVP
jgi:uncharacterized protein YjbI with pentapeptide repeats